MSLHRRAARQTGLAAVLVRAPCKTACRSTRSPAMTTLYTQLLKAQRKNVSETIERCMRKARENVLRQGFYRTTDWGPIINFLRDSAILMLDY